MIGHDPMTTNSTIIKCLFAQAMLRLVVRHTVPWYTSKTTSLQVFHIVLDAINYIIWIQGRTHGTADY